MNTKPIRVFKTTTRAWVVYVHDKPIIAAGDKLDLGTESSLPYAFPDKKSACHIAFQYGYYKLKLGQFQYTWCEGC